MFQTPPTCRSGTPPRASTISRNPGGAGTPEGTRTGASDTLGSGLWLAVAGKEVSRRGWTPVRRAGTLIAGGTHMALSGCIGTAAAAAVGGRTGGQGATRRAGRTKSARRLSVGACCNGTSLSSLNRGLVLKRGCTSVQAGGERPAVVRGERRGDDRGGEG